MQHAAASEDFSDQTHTSPFEPQILVQLTQQFDAKHIAYCCWPRFDKPKFPEANPLFFDFLIKQTDTQQLQEVMLTLGFKKMHSNKKKQATDRVLSYLGFNPTSGELFHFRVYSQLMLEDLATHNIYPFPLEIPMLETAIREGLVKVPSPEIALMLFVISTALKYTTGLRALGKRTFLSQWELKELERLKAETTRNDTNNIIRHHLPSANKTIFDDCLSLLQGDISIRSRIHSGYQLRKQLLTANGYAPFSAHWMGWWHLTADTLFRIPRATNQKPAASGAIIAIVGSDGAGKSTAIDGLHGWISNYFWTRQIHLGKPPRSISSFILYTVLRAGRLADRILKKEWFIRPVAELNVPLVIRYLRLLQYVLIARDRQRIYRQARNLANSGALVISDRFPLPQLKLMDGPHAAQLIQFKKQPDRLVEFLLSMEQKYYTPIKLPELLVVLRVDPEIAVQRRSDENITLIRPRAQEVWDTDWQKTAAHVIDSSQSRAAIVSELKALVWSLF